MKLIFSKPVAPKGKLPCGHPAALYTPERGCHMVLDVRKAPKGSENRYEIIKCGRFYRLLYNWGERYPVRYFQEEK